MSSTSPSPQFGTKDVTIAVALDTIMPAAASAGRAIGGERYGTAMPGHCPAGKQPAGFSFARFCSEAVLRIRAQSLDAVIAIRTAVIQDGKLHVQAGAGIVYDSDPEKEWEETMSKGRALFRAVAEAAGGCDE